MYQVTFLDPNDRDLVEEVLSYVKAKGDHGIRPRPDWVMSQAIATGEILLLWRDGEIAGTSFVYEFHEGPGDPDGFLELGTMMIPDKRDNGFRGQQVFGLLHIFNICYMNDRAVPRVFAVVEAETASHHIMTKHVRMIPNGIIPEKLAMLRAAAGTPFNPKKMTVWADDDAILYNLRTLKNLIVEENLIQTPKGETRISVDVHPVNHENLDMLIARRL